MRAKRLAEDNSTAGRPGWSFALPRSQTRRGPTASNACLDVLTRDEVLVDGQAIASLSESRIAGVRTCFRDRFGFKKVYVRTTSLRHPVFRGRESRDHDGALVRS